MLATTATPESISTACPTCGSADTRHSRQSASADAERSQQGEYPFRCRKCGARFYAAASPPASSQKRRRSREKSLREFWKHRRGIILQLALFLIVLLLFLACLRYLTHDHPDTSPSTELWRRP